MTQDKLLHLSYSHLLIFMIFFNLSNIKALLQDSKGEIHSLLLCGEFIWLFSLETCPVSLIFTWCFCRVPGQGNHSPNHWVTWRAQLSTQVPLWPLHSLNCFSLFLERDPAWTWDYFKECQSYLHLQYPDLWGEEQGPEGPRTWTAPGGTAEEWTAPDLVLFF